MTGRAPAVVDTPSREVMATGFWITHCGHDLGGPLYQRESRVAAEHVLVMTADGEGWYRVSGRRGSVTTGDLLLLPAGLDHGFGTGPSGRWDLLYAHIAGPAVGPLLACWPGFTVGRYTMACPLADTTHLLLTALAELREQREAYGLAAASYVRQAIQLAIVEARRMARGPHPHAPVAVAVQNYIHAHLDSALTLEEIAGHVHLSPSYLCRVFKSATGYSPVEYAIKQRINLAKRLLNATDQAVSAVGKAVGYNDAGYFARVFRMTTGVSPSAYRRMNLTSTARSTTRS